MTTIAVVVVAVVDGGGPSAIDLLKISTQRLTYLHVGDSSRFVREREQREQRERKRQAEEDFFLDRHANTSFAKSRLVVGSLIIAFDRFPDIDSLDSAVNERISTRPLADTTR